MAKNQLTDNKTPIAPSPDNSPTTATDSDTLIKMMEGQFSKSDPKEAPSAKPSKNGKVAKPKKVHEPVVQTKPTKGKEEQEAEPEGPDLGAFDPLQFGQFDDTDTAGDDEVDVDVEDDVDDLEDEPEPGEGEDEDEEIDVKSVEKDRIDPSKETNLKNLRNLAKDLKAEKTALESRLAAYENQKTGFTALQSQVSKLEKRVKELEPYEMVHALHNNPTFKSKYIEGEAQVADELKSIAKDYGVEESVIENAIATSNRRELNELIGEYFSDPDAKSDIKSGVQKIHGLRAERQKLEAESQDSLLKFQEADNRVDAERKAQRKTLLQQTLSKAWTHALVSNSELPEEKRIYELIEVPGKKDHNEKVVRPLLDKSKNDLEKIIGHLEYVIENRSSLSPEAISYLATVIQQANAAQMIHYTRSGIYNQLKKLRTDETKKEGRNRPSVNTAPRSRKVSTDSGKRKSGRDRAAEVFESVMSEGA